MPIQKDSPYTHNSLRPNPVTADPSRGDQAFLQEVINVGHFDKAGEGAVGWAASARIVNGLPKPGMKPGGRGLNGPLY